MQEKIKFIKVITYAFWRFSSPTTRQTLSINISIESVSSVTDIFNIASSSIVASLNYPITDGWRLSAG